MTCVLCRNEVFKILSQKDSKDGLFLKVILCESCGMVQQDPIPSEDKVNEYYSNEYRKDYKKTITPKIKHVFRAGNLALDRINFLKKRGIASGSFLMLVLAAESLFMYLGN